MQLTRRAGLEDPLRPPPPAPSDQQPTAAAAGPLAPLPLRKPTRPFLPHSGCTIEQPRRGPSPRTPGTHRPGRKGCGARGSLTRQAPAFLAARRDLHEVADPHLLVWGKLPPNEPAAPSEDRGGNSVALPRRPQSTGDVLVGHSAERAAGPPFLVTLTPRANPILSLSTFTGHECGVKPNTRHPMPQRHAQH